MIWHGRVLGFGGVLLLGVGCPTAGGSADESDGSSGTDTGGSGTAGTVADTTMPDEGPDDATGGETGDDTGAVDSSGDEDGTGTTGAVACAGGNICVPPIGPMWNGPAALNEIDVERGLPVCGASYGSLEADLFGDVSGTDPAVCTCECEVSSAACDGSARVRISGNAGVDPQLSPCSPMYGGIDALLSQTVVSGAPLEWDVGELDWGGNADTRGVTVDNVMADISGMCAPDATTTVDTAAFGDRLALCGGSVVEGACNGDGLCVPAPADPLLPSVCVWADGDMACPAGYPDRQLLHEDFSDTRACTTCSCGAIEGECDTDDSPTVELTVWVENTLGTSESAPIVFADDAYCEPQALCTGTCIPSSVSLASVSFVPGPDDIEMTAECPPSGGNPTGEITLEGTTTVCCTGG